MPVCFCGHADDEHKEAFLAFCEVEGCECLDFEEDEDAEEIEDPDD